MVNPGNILYGFTLFLILSGMLWSCADPDSLVSDPGQSSGSEVRFSFTISTGDIPVSRAPGVWEEDAATIGERILSPDDMRIHIFSQSGVLLKTVVPTSLEYSGTGNDGYYALSVAFTHDYFDKFDENDIVPFSVMILANMKAAGGQYLTYNYGLSVIGSVTDWFNINAEYTPSATAGVPMYGIKGFAVSKKMLTQGIDAAFAGDIDMLRALCKIEISDRIANAAPASDGNKYPMVTGVEMISWTDKGYIRPAFDDYTAGLKYANIYPESVSRGPITAKRTGSNPACYRIYCPEAHVKDIRFRVEAIMTMGASPQYFEVSLDKFTDGIGTDLIRNHIYRFDVHALNTVADITATVGDWIVKTEDFELDNVVSMEADGFLEWTYDPDNFSVSAEMYNGTEEQQLSILNGTNSCATGRFCIASPVGATWKAYFIPGENGVDAFEFVDMDGSGNIIPGSERVYAEGRVGEPAIIHVRGKGNADSYRHWAELVVEVKTVDGLTLHAPLTSGMSHRFIIYRENKM